MQLKLNTITMLLLCTMIFGTQLKATTYTLVSEYGMWNDPSMWSPAGIPGADDDVIMNIANGVVYLENDITVRNFTIERLAHMSSLLNGGTNVFTITVTNRLESKYVTSFANNLHLVSGASGIFNHANYTQPFAAYYFNGEVKVDGNLTFATNGFSANSIVINGTLNHLSGDLLGAIKVAQTGTLNMDAQSSLVRFGGLQNQGTFNWKNGKILANSNIINSGRWNITSPDSMYTDDFTNTASITNTGQIVQAPGVNGSTIALRMSNSGSITVGANLGLMGVKGTGSITGGVGSILRLSGWYFDSANELQSGAVLNVSKLITAYGSSVEFKPGSVIGPLMTEMDFSPGELILGIPLPSAAKYNIHATVQSNVNQVFTGDVTVRGSFSGSGSLTFNSPNVQFVNPTLGSAITETTPNTVVQMTGLQADNFINRGTINWDSSGILGLREAGFSNLGTLNITAKAPQIFQYSNTIDPLTPFKNAGTINYTFTNGSGSLEMWGDLENTGAINVGEADSLKYGGRLDQKGSLVGTPSSMLQIHSGIISLRPNSTTSNWASLATQFSTSIFLEAGATLGGIANYALNDSEFDARITPDQTANYRLNQSTMRLYTQWQPTTVLYLLNSGLEGSGSLRISNELDWEGGTIDIPVRILEGASALIRESDSQRPIISSPFTNLGSVVLQGGIIELNTAFFKNIGTWTVKSDEDVIIDGVTPFTNEGLFAICGNQPIQIVFNIPFINESTGTFQGQGSYTFNAGYTNNGTAAPGCSPGVLRIADDFNTGAGLLIEIEGNSASQYDFLEVEGKLKLEGKLRVEVPTGAAPSGAITVARATGGITGAFSALELPLNYTAQVVQNELIITATGVVSTSELLEEAKVTISPTVATDQIVITAQSPLRSDAQLQFISVTGSVEQELALAAGTKDWTVSVGFLSPGLYFLRTEAGVLGKFVKL